MVPDMRALALMIITLPARDHEGKAQSRPRIPKSKTLNVVSFVIGGPFPKKGFCAKRRRQAAPIG
jgi:hypothetical protein